jgi:hypothetical protein
MEEWVFETRTGRTAIKFLFETYRTVTRTWLVATVSAPKGLAIVHLRIGDLMSSSVLVPGLDVLDNP